MIPFSFFSFSSFGMFASTLSKKSSSGSFCFFWFFDLYFFYGTCFLSCSLNSFFFISKNFCIARGIYWTRLFLVTIASNNFFWAFSISSKQDSANLKNFLSYGMPIYLDSKLIWLFSFSILDWIASIWDRPFSVHNFTS